MPTIRTSFDHPGPVGACRCPHGLRLDELASRSSLQPKQPAHHRRWCLPASASPWKPWAGDITYECRAKKTCPAPLNGCLWALMRS